MSLVNLLPPGLRQRQETRRLTMIVIGGGVVLIGLVLFIYTLQRGHLASVNDQITTTQNLNATLGHQVAVLQKYEVIQQKAIERQGVLQQAFANEAPFSTLLEEISSSMPSNAYLTTISVTIGGVTSSSTSTTTGSATTTTPGTALVGGATGDENDPTPVGLPHGRQNGTAAQEG